MNCFLDCRSVLRSLVVSMLAGIALVGSAYSAAAADAFLPALFKSPDFIDKAGLALGLILLLAILIENALAVIFNWRLFLAYVSLRGMRTPIMFAVSLVIVLTFDLDIVAELFNINRPSGAAGAAAAVSPAAGNILTVVLTALILSGGSAGVHNLFRTFGLRTDTEEKVRQPKAPAGEAWVSVTVNNLSGKQVAQVHIDKYAAPSGHKAPAKQPLAIAGTVQAHFRGPASYLFRNRNRFPQNGGYSVKPDTHYIVAVSWLDDNDQMHWVYPANDGFVFADRAIVDFEVTI